MASGIEWGDGPVSQTEQITQEPRRDVTQPFEISNDPPLKLAACGRTDIGCRRPHNEDSILLNEATQLFVVADGMGGHAAGEVASRTAVEALREFLAKTANDADFTWPFGVREGLSHGENLINTGIQLANRKVCEVAGENPDFLGMGTTIVALIGQPVGVVMAHVGDSRIYRRRGEVLEQLTSDHSWVNEQIQRNILTEEEARNHRWRNVITRALGNRAEIEVDLRSLPVEHGDLFLLCSDGLTSMIDDARIDLILRENDGDLSAACNNLIDAANQAGGFDNISVILVQVQARP
jgi:protein phosphatase